MSFVIPVGIDFADGVTLLNAQPNNSGGTPMIIGTALPTAALYIYSSGATTDLIQEQPGSPEIERAEQCTCRHDLKMPYTQGLEYWSVMGRGVMVTDTAANVWRILSCNIKRDAGTFCVLSYVMESISFDSPPDDFDVQEVSLDLNILKHPRYNWALLPYITDASTYALVGDLQIFYVEQKEAIVRMIQNYIESPFYPSQAQVQGLIQSNILSMLNLKPGQSTGTIQVNYPNNAYIGSLPTDPPVPWDGTVLNRPADNCVYYLISVPFNLGNPSDPITIALAAAYEIISKLWRHEDTPYIAGYKVIWVQKVFATVYINCGGYIEDPRYIVPQYFMSPSNNGIIPRSGASGGIPNDTSSPNGNNSIFDLLPYINPQCYSSTGIQGGPLAFSCLRTTDTIRYDRTFFDLTHSWTCAPVGHWDADLFTQNNRPQLATDYNVLTNGVV